MTTQEPRNTSVGIVGKGEVAFGEDRQHLQPEESRETIFYDADDRSGNSTTSSHVAEVAEFNAEPLPNRKEIGVRDSCYVNVDKFSRDSSQSRSSTHPLSSSSLGDNLKKTEGKVSSDDDFLQRECLYFDADEFDLDSVGSSLSSHNAYDDFRLPDGSLVNEGCLLCAEEESIPSFFEWRDEGSIEGRSSPIEAEESTRGRVHHSAGSTSQCLHSSYGHPLSPRQASKLIPTGDSGILYMAKVVPDDYTYFRSGKSVLTRIEYDSEKKSIRPRCHTLPVTATDFFSSLVRVESVPGVSAGPRWIFTGVLNGWPALKCLELREIKIRRRKRMISRRALMQGRLRLRKVWTADEQGRDGTTPSFPENNYDVRVILRAAPWTAVGWSKENPGYLFWIESRWLSARLSYGEDVVRQIRRDRDAGEEIPFCQRVHMISHRYAKENESKKDKLTYHSIVLLEWDHGRFCTLVEMANLNGISGRGGRFDWYDETMENLPDLYKAMPPEMVAPWSAKYAEIRCFDVQARNVEEFMHYVDRYTGPNLRFLDPQVSFSHDVRLTFRSKENIAQYLLNYIQRDRRYSELNRNCQTFAADLCGFLAGKKDIEPFHPLQRVDYKNRSHLFLYDSHMYEGSR